MIKNSTTNTQVAHRSIRKFKDQTLNDEQLNTIYEAARHTSTSMFYQQFTILHLTDPQKRAAVRSISGQPYVGANGDLFIFIADLYRNQQIRHQCGNDDGRLHTTDLFMQAAEDAVLALQNALTAAESIGLGGVILGSIKNDPEELIRVLELPKMTFPILGLQLGIPDQDPQLKPRLPLSQITFENKYPQNFKVNDLSEYDKLVSSYYDLRDTNKRVDSFTKQINGAKLDRQLTSRDKLLNALHQQGLALE